MARFATIQSAENRLMQAGLSAGTVRPMLDTARHALMFRRRLRPDAEVAIGASKLGGAPDLPPTLDWPHRPAYAGASDMIARMAILHGPTGHVPNAALLAFYARHWTGRAPLSFLGQIDLEAMAAIAPFEAGIDRVGRLLVFADIASFSGGARAEDDGWLSVIHDQSPQASLTRRPMPDDLIATQTTFARLQYRLSADEELDTSETEELEGIACVSLPIGTRDQAPSVAQALRELDLADFAHLMGSGGAGQPTLFSDQLGGYPVPIQNDVFHDLFNASRSLLRPVALGERAGRWDPSRWVHLLSLGGESDNASFPSSWNDGDLYIAQRPDPARPGGLGQTWALSQQT